MAAQGNLVYIADPAFRASRQVALACKEASLPFQFVTSFAYSNHGALARAVGAASTLWGRRINSYLMRRHLPGLDGTDVKVLIGPEAARRIARLMPRGVRPTDSRLVSYQDRLFDLLAARGAPSATKLVYCVEDSAINLLKRAKELGAFGVLEGTVHPDSAVTALGREYERLGIRPPNFDNQWRHRKAAEIATADLIVTQSLAAASTYISAGVRATKVKVIPLGVDLKTFSPGNTNAPPSGPLRALYVGKLCVRKGVPRLLEAMEQTDPALVQLTLIGPMDEELVKYCQLKFARLRDRLKWIPGMARTDLVEHYRNSDVVVLPSLSDSFGQSIVEAMACGKAVLLTDACGAPVTQGKDGIVVAAGDTDELAEALSMYAANRDLIEDLGSAAADTARGYGWERFRLKVARLLRQALVTRDGH